MAAFELTVVVLLGAYILSTANARLGVYFLWFSWIAHLSWFGGLGWLSANNLIAGCSVLAVLMHFRSRRVRWLNNRTTWIVIAWTACLLAGAIRSGRLVERIDGLVPCLCIYCIVVLIDWREEDLWVLLLALAAPTVFQVGKCLVVGGSEVWHGPIRPEVVGVQLNGLAQRCAAMVPLAWGFSKARRRGSRAVGWSLFGAALAGVLITKSRGGAVLFVLAVILTAVAGIAGHGAARRGTRSGSGQTPELAWGRVCGRLGLTLACLAMLVGGLWVVLPARYFARYRYGPDADWAAQHSMALRTAYLRTAFTMWTQRPLLGWGDGAFRRYGEDYVSWRVQAPEEIAVHNDYLWAMANYGLVGLLLVGLLAWSLYRNLSIGEAPYAGQQGRRPATAWLVRALRIHCLLWLAAALLGNGIFETAPFYALCGISVAVRTGLLRSGTRAPGRAPASLRKGMLRETV